MNTSPEIGKSSAIGISDGRSYPVKTFNLGRLHGISDRTLEMHFKLYEGYVQQTNLLLERLADFSSRSQADPTDNLAYAELSRRLGFEYNGMVLHEHYFANLKKFGFGDPQRNSVFHHAAESSYGTYQNWKADFIRKGKMRGVGWVICFQDPRTGQLINHWVTLHEVGHVAGFTPVLVMDVWEHAFIFDYLPVERAKYVEAFFANVDWETVEGRLKSTI
ncbi:MAG TPA: Fe-Mn family superoxide dismutase [Terriglobales bacterium]|jgi:Fe-Mn family superoxide dismutase|nr:Fe-Mn family superoxide dismutase [Terriglobales bacterium]